MFDICFSVFLSAQSLNLFDVVAAIGPWGFSGYKRKADPRVTRGASFWKVDLQLALLFLLLKDRGECSGVDWLVALEVWCLPAFWQPLKVWLSFPASPEASSSPATKLLAIWAGGTPGRVLRVNPDLESLIESLEPETWNQSKLSSGLDDAFSKRRRFDCGYKDYEIRKTGKLLNILSVTESVPFLRWTVKHCFWTDGQTVLSRLSDRI